MGAYHRTIRSRDLRQRHLHCPDPLRGHRQFFGRMPKSVCRACWPPMESQQAVQRVALSITYVEFRAMIVAKIQRTLCSTACVCRTLSPSRAAAAPAWPALPLLEWKPAPPNGTSFRNAPSNRLDPILAATSGLLTGSDAPAAPTKGLRRGGPEPSRQRCKR